YDKNQGNYQGWHVQGNPNSFVNAFLNYFANITMKNRWMSELVIIKQNPEQSVSNYAQKFKMLMQRVDTTREFGQHYIISKFIRGLSSYLMTMIVSHSPQILDAAITKAKKIEAGFTITQPIQQQIM
ncbi:3125_t:CDS:1, partial [Funneliformis geosporum]